uniref:Myb/SANT-like domain-containing protein n=1 Tax=Setaria viridis TaxID=4556 RepID=A0A4V6D5G7_SETVI|nr:hypothetical protein SEVIR_6G161050v2 [Setaria viridis]
MVKEFHLRNKFISYTKAQIQYKEDQLKRDYKMLKAARMQSGSKCNEKRNMVEGPPAMWDNLIVTFLKSRSFKTTRQAFRSMMIWESSVMVIWLKGLTISLLLSHNVRKSPFTKFMM